MCSRAHLSDARATHCTSSCHAYVRVQDAHNFLKVTRPARADQQTTFTFRNCIFSDDEAAGRALYAMAQLAGPACKIHINGPAHVIEWMKNQKMFGCEYVARAPGLRSGLKASSGITAAADGADGADGVAPPLVPGIKIALTPEDLVPAQTALLATMNALLATMNEVAKYKYEIDLQELTKKVVAVLHNTIDTTKYSVNAQEIEKKLRECVEKAMPHSADVNSLTRHVLMIVSKSAAGEASLPRYLLPAADQHNPPAVTRQRPAARSTPPCRRPTALPYRFDRPVGNHQGYFVQWQGPRERRQDHQGQRRQEP